MSQFTGLCIGGPLDGKMLAAPFERWVVEEGPGPEFTWTTPPDMQKGKRLTYKHEGGLKISLGVDLWILEDQTVYDAVHGVFRAYTKLPAVSVEIKGPPVPRPVAEAVEMLAYAGRIKPGQRGKVEFSLGADGKPTGVVIYGGEAQ